MRTIATILLMVMVTQTETVGAEAEWALSEFVIMLTWAEHGNPPDDEERMAALAEAGFNTAFWNDLGKLRNRQYFLSCTLRLYRMV